MTPKRLASTRVGFLLALCCGCGGESNPDAETGGVPVIRPVVDATPIALREVQRLGEVEGDEHAFYGVTGVALDTAGALYVLESGNHRISVFDSSGALLSSWAGAGGPGPPSVRRRDGCSRPRGRA